jgi:hypothetical protein
VCAFAPLKENPPIPRMTIFNRPMLAISAALLVSAVVFAIAWKTLMPSSPQAPVPIPIEVLVVRAKPDPANPLRFAQEPPGAWTSMLKGLGPLSLGPNVLAHVTDAGAIEVRPPLACYRLDTEAGKLPAEPLTGIYVYPTNLRGVPGGEAWFLTDDKGRGPHVLQGGAGPVRSSVAKALDKLATMERIKAGAYEARILTYPIPHAAETVAIWLKASTDGGDLVFAIPYENPFAPAIPPRIAYGLKSYTLYQADEFLAMVMPVINEARSRDHSGASGGL